MVERKSWDDAQQHCMEWGGFLMEVRTQHQYDEARRISLEVRQRAEGWYMHLGGSDAAVEGEWRWASNGEPIDMTRFWTSGQPDGDYDYLVMGLNGFVDHSFSRPFACVKSIYWI